MSDLSQTPHPGNRDTGERLSKDEAVKAVRFYRKKGWRVFPLPVGEKKPDSEAGWKKQIDKVTDEKIEELWKNGENIGVILDPPLVDVDLDCDEAVNIAPRFLPPTPFKFGRGGKITHYFFTADDAKSATFTDPVKDVSKQMLLEIRHNNGYTLVPPSNHPSGERLTMAPEKGWPEAVLFDDLQRRVEVVAAVALMVRHWPVSGGRNEATMALCGGLVRAEQELDDNGKPRINPKLVDEIVRAVVEEGGNADVESDFNLLDRTRRTLQKVADGDQKKKTKGWRSLEGLLGGQGKAVVGRFREWLGIHPKSWNRRDRGAPSPLESVPWADKIPWQLTFYGDKVPEHCPLTIAIIMANDQYLCDDAESGKPLVFLDEFRSCKMVEAPLPWDGRIYAAEQRYPRQWTDHDLLELQAYLVEAWQFKVGKDTTADGASLHAGRHRQHDVREYLNGLIWDGVPRLSAMGEKYFSTFGGDYESAVFRWWMISGVARIFVPGRKADHVLCLEGPQGLGKSSALRVLAVKDDWFTDDHVNMQDKSGAEVIQGSWIVEFAELAALKRPEVEQIKAFVSRQEDKYRPAYGRETITVPRQCIFAGTVNPGAEGYLKDPTGNRRFWPIGCGAKIDLGALAEDRDQLWAEAVAAYRAGEQWWPTEDMVPAIIMEQQQRVADQGFESQLIAWLEEKFAAAGNREYFEFTVLEALIKACDLPVRDAEERRNATLMGQTCSALGFEHIGRRQTLVEVPIGGAGAAMGFKERRRKSVAYRVTWKKFTTLPGVDVDAVAMAMIEHDDVDDEGDVPF